MFKSYFIPPWYPNLFNATHPINPFCWLNDIEEIEYFKCALIKRSIISFIQERCLEKATFFSSSNKSMVLAYVRSRSRIKSLNYIPSQFFHFHGQAIKIRPRSTTHRVFLDIPVPNIIYFNSSDSCAVNISWGFITAHFTHRNTLLLLVNY